MYFLRFTNTAKEDLQRATSLHHSGLDTSFDKQSVADMFGCDVEDVEIVDGLYVQVLNGLCGYMLESETLEEAIEEISDRNYQFSEIGKAVIFEGKYSSDSDFIPDGDLFIPKKIAIEL